MPAATRGIRIAIDRGGTFCDFWASIPGREDDLIFKLLSQNPREYEDAPIEGIRQILEISSGEKIPRGTPLDITSVESIRMGTTVATKCLYDLEMLIKTSALLERKGERVALVITKGFRDLLTIGNQSRPNIFDLSVSKLDRLYEKVLEVDERVTIEGFSEDPEPQQLDIKADPLLAEGLTGEAIRIIQKPDLDQVRIDLQSLWDDGYRTLAIAFLHSFTYPWHETAVAAIARSMGFKVSVSSELQPMIRIVPRAQSATADAYLSPVITQYLEGFRNGFKGRLEDHNAKKLLLCQSDGGLTSLSRFTGLRAILSGPAAGVIGCAKTCYDEEEGTPVLGFDMGGTSTDVSRYSGSFEHIFETTVSQVALQSPQLDVHTVAAGGGSMLFWRNGMFAAGPESAGAYPGPACYGNGGPLTITDANFFLGRILPDYFAKPLDIDIVKEKFQALTKTVNEEKKGSEVLTPEQVAMGFLLVANASMTRPIRALSEGRGFETAAHNLVCFGGAGGQHATAMARDLGIKRVLIHRFSSILSAYGMALADVVVELQEPDSSVYNEQSAVRIQKRAEALKVRATEKLVGEGFESNQIQHEVFLNMRYRGSDTSLMISESDAAGDFTKGFISSHHRQFGFTQVRDILVDDIRVRSTGKAMEVKVKSPFKQLKDIGRLPNPDLKTTLIRKVYFEKEGWVDARVFHLKDVPKGSVILGPAMIIDETQTIVVDPASEASVLEDHVVLEVLDAEIKKVSADEVDPIHLSVFSHRFMSVAEQMGEILRKTSTSTNIKERLDYSCAIFSSDGRLVANAPHIPAHLGSMSYAIAYQAQKYAKGELKPGDVILSNHPIAGGTHLPDLTVTTPVFDENDPTKILFFVANRGHHADIGGIAVGSMPPNSTELWQEGAAIESFKMVKEGVFDEEGLIYHLYETPARYPGCSGTRTLNDNISDLKAGIASNNRGIYLIQSLVREYSWPVVDLYMHAVQKNADEVVRVLLKDFSRRFQGQALEAIDYMDDGTPLALKIIIDPEDGSAHFDFSGTGPEALNNLNSPPAVMYSSIMYCLRSMISSDIPLNQGCLTPIKVTCPPNSILSPSVKAATAGSNVETSQRIIDVILKAFRVAGASQGTCNNLTFGYGGKNKDTGVVTKGFGYYETIAGGAGAGANWEGQSGVHTGSTNTRMTDPETLEKRYPVLLREFSIRKGSGGAGRNYGGDGCVRDIQVLRPLQVSILSERRVIPPYGMAGGDNGQLGVNIWVRRDPTDGSERRISVGGKASMMMNTGDRIIINTPGGGGYGVSPNRKPVIESTEEFLV
ncbi:putative 5-oxoprolinase [Xylogone sp. PMI_703]|nr:putative 5-oxoprolinase [Xylogone sp. PMI_703]